MASEKICSRPTRLQQRAPSSIKIIAPAKTWNVAIPLLSPLASSPVDHDKVEIPSTSSMFSSSCKEIVMNNCYDEVKKNKVELSEQTKRMMAWKKWQVPGAPFRYEHHPPLKAPSSVPVLIDT